MGQGALRLGLYEWRARSPCPKEPTVWVSDETRRWVQGDGGSMSNAPVSESWGLCKHWDGEERPGLVGELWGAPCSVGGNLGDVMG